MYSYLAYNLRVESDLLLPGFLAASGEQLPSIRVRRDSIAEENLWDLNNDGDRLAGVAPEVLRFIVEGGRSLQ